MPTVTPGVGAITVAGLAPSVVITPATSTISEVQYASVSASAAGHNMLVDAVPGQRIRVVSLVLIASGGANTVQLTSGAGGTVLAGAMDLASDGQLVLPYQAAGWCQTEAGRVLNLELSDAALVAGVVGYITA